MNLQYQLEDIDTVQALMFYTWQNPTFKKKRNRNWLINTLALFSLSLCFWISNNNYFATWFLIAGVILGCGFPFYIRWQQKRNFINYIANFSKDWEQQVCKLVIEDGYIEISDNDSWAKIALKRVAVVHEITSYFFIRFKSGTTIVIPKNKINDVEAVRKELMELQPNFNIPMVTDLKWTI